MGKKIFLSYPSQSKNIAELLKVYLKSKGIESIWFDREEIIASQNIQERLKEGIKDAACCVFLLSEDSVKSTWCMAEVGAFWGADKPIIIYPVMPECNEIPILLNGLKKANENEDVYRSCKEIIDKTPITMNVEPLPEILSQCGLKNAFRIPIDDHKRDIRVAELIANERSKIEPRYFRLLASSGFNYLHKVGRVWRAGLGDAITDDKIKFSVVLESPFSAFSYARALASQERKHQWKEKMDLDQIEKLENMENVNIRVTEYPINCSLFFTSEAVFYDPYLWSKPKKAEPVENHFWVFDFEKKSESLDDFECYHLLKLHFDFLYKESTPLLDFLGEGRKRYEELTREFEQKMSEMLNMK